MRFPPSVHNRLSYAGATIAALAFIVFVFLVVLENVSGAGRAPYAGIVIFVVVPAFLLLGLVLIPVGMRIEARRQQREARPSGFRFLVVDFNDPRQRNAALVFVTVSILLLFLTVFGSYQAYEATESVGFCGRLCHQVMSPEYTAYEHSPHARVLCVDCHVGPGASWYVKSKLSGAYQVYAVLFDKYPRPIPAPITSLRPAQETCEQCHWPDKFFGGQQQESVHFLPDEGNTRWEINLLVKTGGGSPATGRTEGIHWHMNIAFRVDYFTTDPKRQDIAWVRTTELGTGKVTEYTKTGKPLSDEEKSSGFLRPMDCMDCHDRPTHIFRSPTYLVDVALDTGALDPTLPFIKKTAVTLLGAEYASLPAALGAIEEGIGGFYQKQYPDILSRRGATIKQAVTAVQEMYREDFFPDMKVRWDTYADNIGHLIFPGCYRCHGALLRVPDGKVLTKSCTMCHIIMSQGTPPHARVSMREDGLEFQHPQDIGGLWKDMDCSQCHSGMAP
jgi:hypothetical protein